MWAFAVGDDSDSAGDAAREKQSGYTYTIQGGCLAVALFKFKDFPEGGIGIGRGNSREEAASAAVAECESIRSSYPGVRVEACRVAAASPSGVPGVACVEDFGGGAVQAAASPGASSAEWGGMAFGIAFDSVDGLAYASAWAWAFEYGDSGAAARTAAQDRCEGLLGRFCEQYSGAFENTCAAIAVSECPSGCSLPGYGISRGSSEREASRGAIELCESSQGGVRDLSRGDERPGRTGGGLRRRCEIGAGGRCG